jgi:hypothetical protein
MNIFTPEAREYFRQKGIEGGKKRWEGKSDKEKHIHAEMMRSNWKEKLLTITPPNDILSVDQEETSS